MRFRVRRADIAAELREQFELYGAEVVSLALGLGVLQGGGLSGPPSQATQAMMLVHQNQKKAAAWLREQRDYDECHATRLEFVEWAILIFVVLSVGIEIYNLMHVGSK